MKKVFALILLCFIPILSSVAGVRPQPLPAERAFVFSVYASGPDQLIAEWQIAPGYYLYQDRLNIIISSPRSATITKITLPKAGTKKDNVRGMYQIYSGVLRVPISIQNGVDQKIQLRVDYQGCSQGGFCYPPVHKTVALHLSHPMQNPDGPSASLPPSLLTDQNGVQTVLQMHNLGVMFLLFTGLGLLLAFTPCVLPMIPILAGIIVGQKQPVHARKAFLLSFFYVLGMATTYALAGVMAALLGGTVQVWLQRPWIIAAFSSLFVLLALSLFGFYELRLPKQIEQRAVFLSSQQKGGSYLSVFLMGVLSTLIVSPCVTAPLVGTLIYIGQTGDVAFGASALFAMGLGMGIPLMMMGVSAGKWLPKGGPWMEVVRKFFGILMLGMAIWLLSRVVSTTLILFLWGSLLFGTAFFLGIFLPRFIGWPRLNGGIGVLVGISGMLVMLGATVGGSHLVTTLKHSSDTVQMKAHAFMVVRNNVQLDQQLALAKAAQKPVMLDFYADWCDSCVEMDRNVFASPRVKQALTRFVLLRANITDNSVSDDAMMKRFQVIAPPTVLFFDAKGRELTAKRIVGEVDAKEFLQRTPGAKNAR